MALFAPVLALSRLQTSPHGSMKILTFKFTAKQGQKEKKRPIVLFGSTICKSEVVVNSMPGQKKPKLLSASTNRKCASPIKYFFCINTLTFKLMRAASDLASKLLHGELKGENVRKATLPCTRLINEGQRGYYLGALIDCLHGVNGVTSKRLSICFWQIYSSQASYRQIRSRAAKHRSLTAVGLHHSQNPLLFFPFFLFLFGSLKVIVEQFIQK